MSDTNKVKKYTRKLFIETAQTEPIALGNEYYYVAKKINSDNFIMNPKLEEQLVKEGLYNNSYITFRRCNYRKPERPSIAVNQES